MLEFGVVAMNPGGIEEKMLEVEALVASGAPIGQAIKRVGIASRTYYHWRKKMARPNLGQHVWPDGSSDREKRATLDRVQAQVVGGLSLSSALEEAGLAESAYYYWRKKLNLKRVAAPRGIPRGSLAEKRAMIEQVDALVATGRTMGNALLSVGIVDSTYRTWKKQLNLPAVQARKLRAETSRNMWRLTVKKVDDLATRGVGMQEAFERVGVSGATYYRWRKKLELEPSARGAWPRCATRSEQVRAVARVDALVKAGQTKASALDEVGLPAWTYYRWKRVSQ